MFGSTVFFAVIWNTFIDLYFAYLIKTHTFISELTGNTARMIVYFVIWLLCHTTYIMYHKYGRMYLDD